LIIYSQIKINRFLILVNKIKIHAKTIDFYTEEKKKVTESRKFIPVTKTKMKKFAISHGPDSLT